MQAAGVVCVCQIGSHEHEGWASQQINSSAKVVFFRTKFQTKKRLFQKYHNFVIFTKNPAFSTKNTKNRHKCALRPLFCRGDKLYQPDRKMRPALSCVALRPFFQHHCRCRCRWVPLMSAAPALCALRCAALYSGASIPLNEFQNLSASAGAILSVPMCLFMFITPLIGGLN